MSGEEIFRTLYFYASNPSTRCRDQKNPLGPRQFFHKKQTTPLKTYMTMEKKQPFIYEDVSPIENILIFHVNAMLAYWIPVTNLVKLVLFHRPGCCKRD